MGMKRRNRRKKNPKQKGHCTRGKMAGCYSITSQKTIFFIITAMRTMNLTLMMLSLGFPNCMILLG
jgi:hypothetical protein